MDASSTDPRGPADPDNPLFEELLWVHSMVRRDLELVTGLAERVADGLDAPAVREQLDSLQTDGPLWQLKVNCLHYCRFVESHHRLEDLALFPAARRANPEIDSVVDRLKAEHREVAKLLDEVEGAAEALQEAEGNGARARVVTALETLAGTLVAHLEFEEQSLESTLLTMRSLRG